MMRPRVPRIGPDVDRVVRTMVARGMIAGAVVLAVSLFSIAVGPGIACKKEKRNGCHYDPFEMMCFHRVPPI